MQSTNVVLAQPVIDRIYDSLDAIAESSVSFETYVQEIFRHNQMVDALIAKAKAADRKAALGVN